MGYLSALAWPTVSLGWTLSIFQRGRASMKRLEEIFAATPTATIAGDEARLADRGLDRMGKRVLQLFRQR